MDRLKWEGAAAVLKKYGIAAAVLLAGLLLMVFPVGEETSVPAVPASSEKTLEEALSDILSNMEGAGKVKVLLTESHGAQTLYQTEEDISEGETGMQSRRETVIITGSDRAQSGLVRQILPPKYQGAVVLCQGGADDRVRLQIVNAVMSATGLRSDKITVLKMK